MLCKKDVLRNFAKFTGKHLCQSLFFNKRIWHRCFPMNFANLLRTPFFIEPLWLLLLKPVIWFHLHVLISTCFFLVILISFLTRFYSILPYFWLIFNWFWSMLGLLLTVSTRFCSVLFGSCLSNHLMKMVFINVSQQWIQFMEKNHT